MPKNILDTNVSDFLIKNFSLVNKVALVTGGNMEIGYEIALALAKAGADLYIFCYDNTNTAQMEKEVVKLGRKIVFEYGDLTNSKTLVQIVPHVLQNFQHLDIVVNNAGAISISRTPILAGTDEEWQRVIAINLTAVYQLSRESAQVMVNQQSGKIINIASMLSYQGGKFVPSYTASKYGAAGLTKAFCNELASYNIQVNAIAPGYIETANTAPIRQDPVRSAEILNRIPSGRWGQPRDFGLTAVFLASPASDYLNGSLIPMDGGWLAR